MGLRPIDSRGHMAIDKVSFMVLQSIQFQLPLTKGWCVQRDYLDCPNCRPESSDDSARTKGKRASRVFVTPDGYGWHGFTSKITIHYSSRDTTSTIAPHPPPGAPYPNSSREAGHRIVGPISCLLLEVDAVGWGPGGRKVTGGSPRIQF